MGLAFSLARARRLGVDGELPPTRWCCARSATRRPTTPPRCRPSTPRATPRASACRCRSCSSARTTAPASACRTPDDWIRETFAAQPHLRYVLGGRRAGRGVGRHRRGGALRAQLAPAGLPAPAARCACGAMPAATRSMPTAAPRRSRTTRRGDPLLAQRAPPDRDRRDLGAAIARLVDETRARVMAAAEEAARRPRLDTTEAVVGPMAPYHPSRVSRARRPTAARPTTSAAKRVADPLPEAAANPERPDAGRQPERRAGR